MDPASNTTFDYNPTGSAPSEGGVGAQPSVNNTPDVVSWSAPEFIEHSRNSSWYLFLFSAIAIISVVFYLLTNDIFAVGATIVVGIIFGVAAGHKPHTTNYEISSSGLKIGNKNYPYSLFKTFSIADEGALNSINFEPIKRFMPPVSAYFEPKDEDRIVQVIGDSLPYQEHKLDMLDNFIRQIHF